MRKTPSPEEALRRARDAHLMLMVRPISNPLLETCGLPAARRRAGNASPSKVVLEVAHPLRPGPMLSKLRDQKKREVRRERGRLLRQAEETLAAEQSERKALKARYQKRMDDAGVGNTHCRKRSLYA